MKEYFYIIKRDGHILEIENTGDRFSTCLEQIKNSGIIVFSTLGIAINSVDISEILNSEQYNGYIDSAQPKQFIINGTWYDIKERSKPIRYEKWRTLELEEKKKLLLDNHETNIPQEKINEMLKKYRPDFLKNIKTN